jgi:hypothetical protein
VGLEDDEFLRILHWQRLQDHRVEQAEHGRVGTDAERHRQHDGGGETGVPPQHPSA